MMYFNYKGSIFARGIALISVVHLAGCATLRSPMNIGSTGTVFVESTVSAYRDDKYAGRLSKENILNFISSTAEDVRVRSENQEVILACREAAELLGYRTVQDQKSCDDCVDVLSMHLYESKVVEGAPETNCSSFYGSYYSSASCYTYRPKFRSNNRWLGLTFFASELKKSIYQADAYSTGSVRSVVQVAIEMCYAALLNYPNKFERADYRVSWGLKRERTSRAIASDP